MKILVFGSAGQLGTDLIRALKESGEDYFAAVRQDADITKPEEVRQLLDKEKPDAVINPTAYHDVGKCEEEPALAMEVNATAVEALARACQARDIKLVTMSSDYVFDGAKTEGYSEDDPAYPLTWYGKSKLAGEWLARSYNKKTFVVRTQSLYGVTGPKGKGLNFVDMMLKLSQERDELKVDQCRMSPTWTYPLAKNLIALLKTDSYGLYHMSCEGMTTWFEFAKRIIELAGRSVKMTAVANDFFPKNFQRPENTYLHNKKLDEMGVDLMPHWEDALKGYLKEKGLKIECKDAVENKGA